MSETLPVVYLARHGKTAWSLSGQHTGLTDLPLTDRGERNARKLGDQLRMRRFARVFTSPLQRAARTCELAGFGSRSEVDRDLVEWNYGEYEGLRTEEIHTKRPGWELFRDGCPGGDSLGEVEARADRVIGRVRMVKGDALIFSSGHFLRVLTARWLGLGPGGRQILPAEHCELERAQLRAHSVAACYPAFGTICTISCLTRYLTARSLK
jgi:probable phosphoglycerate mutase